MQFKFSKLVVLLVAAAMVFGFTTTTRTTAQDGAYVKTFDLTLPTADGVYKGIDPKGAKVTWWHNHTGAREDAVKAATEAFNKGNPWGITVEPINKGSYPVIYQAMLAGLQTGEIPQLTVAYQNQAATYQNAKALVDLDAFVKDPVLGFGKDLTDDFFQGFLASDVNPQFGNQRLGMTVYRSMESLYYNVDALTKLGYTAPPKTWDEFKEMSCKFVKEGLGTDGYQVRTDASFVAAAAFAQGGDIYDAAADTFTYDTPEVKVMPQVMQDMIAEGCAKVITENFGDQNSFIAGNALFYTGSSSGIPFVADGIAKAPTQFAFDIAPIPYKDAPVQDVYGASVSIPVTTREQELAAWLFVRWFDEPDQQAAWAAASNYFPVRKSTASGLTDVFTKIKAFQSAFDLLGSTKAEPPIAGYDPVRALASAALNNVLDGASVDEEFAKLNEEANKVLAANKPGSPLPTPLPTATATPSK
ncbi:MAG: extracellular solute-binding protein [Anaerolineae bacterium]|nr:extracellular solute-binding protein [Anaerolineae bacterium]